VRPRSRSPCLVYPALHVIAGRRQRQTRPGPSETVMQVRPLGHAVSVSQRTSQLLNFGPCVPANP
jgi:hypothetical protein